MYKSLKRVLNLFSTLFIEKQKLRIKDIKINPIWKTLNMS